MLAYLRRRVYMECTLAPPPEIWKLMHLSRAGNSKVNGIMHPLPWKFQGSSTGGGGGVQIIIGITQFNSFSAGSIKRIPCTEYDVSLHIFGSVNTM